MSMILRMHLGNKCAVCAEDVDGVSSRRRGSYFMVQVVMYNCTVLVSLPETNETTTSFCLEFNSSNDSFVVALEIAIDEEEYFIAILIKTNNRRFITNKVAHMT